MPQGDRCTSGRAAPTTPPNPNNQPLSSPHAATRECSTALSANQTAHNITVRLHMARDAHCCANSSSRRCMRQVPQRLVSWREPNSSQALAAINVHNRYAWWSQPSKYGARGTRQHQRNRRNRRAAKANAANGASGSPRQHLVGARRTPELQTPAPRQSHLTSTPVTNQQAAAPSSTRAANYPTSAAATQLSNRKWARLTTPRSAADSERRVGVLSARPAGAERPSAATCG